MLIFLILASGKFSAICDNANAKTYSGYAKVLDGCVLYKDAGLSSAAQGVIFEIPESYFVYILEEVSNEILKVQYGKFVGFVKASMVVRSTFVPVVKTLDGVTCDIKSTAGTQVWSSPSSNSRVLTTISAGTKNISYIAKCVGDVPTGGQSNVWFYVSYTPEFNSTNVYEGYVYSENVTNLSSIFLNTESNPEVLNESDKSENVIFISSSIKTVLIVLIAIPIIVLILIILYKLSKKYLKNTNKSQFDEKYNYNKTDDFEEKNENKLNNQLNNFKNLSFIKRHAVSENNTPTYPEFPHYDSEDDLL